MPTSARSTFVSPAVERSGPRGTFVALPVPPEDTGNPGQPSSLQATVEFVDGEIRVSWIGIPNVTIYMRAGGTTDWGDPIYSGEGGLFPSGWHFIRVLDLEAGSYEFRIVA
jgi:hypothetical protein